MEPDDNFTCRFNSIIMLVCKLFNRSLFDCLEGYCNTLYCIKVILSGAYPAWRDTCEFVKNNTTTICHNAKISGKYARFVG